MKRLHDGHLILLSLIAVILILSATIFVGWRSLNHYQETIDDYIAIDEAFDTLSQAQFKLLTYRLEPTQENSAMASEDISQSLSLLSVIHQSRPEQFTKSFDIIVELLERYKLSFRQLLTARDNTQEAFITFSSAQKEWFTLYQALFPIIVDKTETVKDSQSLVTEVNALDKFITRFYHQNELRQKLRTLELITQHIDKIESILSHNQGIESVKLRDALYKLEKQFKQLKARTIEQLTIQDTISELSMKANSELYLMKNKELGVVEKSRTASTYILYFAVLFILIISLLTFMVKRSTNSIVKMSEKMKTAMLKADNASEIKSNFIANVSHELRTPMNAIIGLSYLALQTDLDEKQKSYIEKVHHSSESLLSLLNNILDYSSIDSGKVDIDDSEFNLHDLLVNLSHYLLLLIEDKKIELVLDLPAHMPSTFMGDPLRLRQILVNIVGNAIKFTEHGEVLVAVTLTPLDKSNALVSFKIKDSGMGIKQEDLAQLFTTFSQVDNTSTRQYGGTGLGLAISKQLIDVMGGSIDVTSVYGEGAEFNISVPLKHAHGSDNTEIENSLFKPLNVLVVEDNELARSVLSRILNELKLTYSVVNDGDEAVAQFESSSQNAPYNLLILDWAMPTMDGLTALHHINRLVEKQGWQMPKSIMTTMYDQATIFRQPHSEHIDLFLDKPLTAKTLYNAIEAVWNGDDKPSKDQQQQTQLRNAVERLNGANVLLVEDNEVNQELMVNLLENYRISVTVANHGAEALVILENNAFDGILMDCHMPIMDGYQATQAIRENPHLVNLPIIAITASAMPGDKEKVLACGMNDHITKPINASQLFQTMARWISPSNTLPDNNVALQTDHNEDNTSDEHEHEHEQVAVNIDKGLEISLGSESLFHDLLLRFVKTEKDFAVRIETYLNEETFASVKLAAHSMRGSASNIGALTLANSAKQLELACEEPTSKDTLQTQLKNVNTKLKEVIAFIDSKN